jgi:hypothetical protein
MSDSVKGLIIIKPLKATCVACLDSQICVALTHSVYDHSLNQCFSTGGTRPNGGTDTWLWREVTKIRPLMITYNTKLHITVRIHLLEISVLCFDLQSGQWDASRHTSILFQSITHSNWRAVHFYVLLFIRIQKRDFRHHVTCHPSTFLEDGLASFT